MIPSEREFQDEQNYANFGFIAPSSEELWVHMPFECTHMVKVVITVDFITPHWKELRS